MILLDADVLLIDIRFPRDANFAVNQIGNRTQNTPAAEFKKSLTR